MRKPCGSTGLMVGCSKVAGTTPFSRVGRKAMSLPLQASARLTPCPASGVQPLVCALPTSAFSRQVKGPSPRATDRAGRLGRPGWPTPWLRAGAFWVETTKGDHGPAIALNVFVVFECLGARMTDGAAGLVQARRKRCTGPRPPPPHGARFGVLASLATRTRDLDAGTPRSDAIQSRVSGLLGMSGLVHAF